MKSIRYRGPRFKRWLAAFVVVFLLLGYLGTVPTNVWGQISWLGNVEAATAVGRLCTIVYFLFFILMPWYTKNDKVLPVPTRVTFK